MAEYEEYEDISQLKAGIKSSQVSNKDLYEAIENLARLLNDMFSMFKNASEQMKLEESIEQERETAHGEILKKLDEIIEQNKTIATGMVDVSDMVKEKLGEAGKPPAFVPPQPQPNWQPRPPEPIMPRIGMPGMGPPRGPPRVMGTPTGYPPGFGAMPNMPPPGDLPPLDIEGLDEFPLEEPRKKKGFHLFGK